MKGLVSYDFLHGLGRKPGPSIIAAFEGVIQLYAAVPAPPEVGILLDLAADDDPALKAAFTDLCAQYGREPAVQKGFHIDGRVFRAYRWTISSEAIESVLPSISKWRSQQPRFAARLGIQIWWRFFWRDPVTGERLPGQDALPLLDLRRPGPSTIGLTVREASSAALWLLFPFPALEDTATSYIRSFEAALPLRLSVRHWRLWKPYKNGEWRPRRCNPLARTV